VVLKALFRGILRTIQKEFNKKTGFGKLKKKKKHLPDFRVLLNNLPKIF